MMLDIILFKAYIFAIKSIFSIDSFAETEREYAALDLVLRRKQKGVCSVEEKILDPIQLVHSD